MTELWKSLVGNIFWNGQKSIKFKFNYCLQKSSRNGLRLLYLIRVILFFNFSFTCCNAFLLLTQFFFQMFQLLDIVYREETLLNVIRSVTKNGRSILLTAVLAVILIYLFSIVGFTFFKGDFLIEIEEAVTLQGKREFFLHQAIHWAHKSSPKKWDNRFVEYDHEFQDLGRKNRISYL